MTKFTFANWKKLLPEQKEAATKMLAEVANHSLAAKRTAQLLEAGSEFNITGFIAHEAFIALANEKPIAIVTARVFPEEKELLISYTISPLGEAKKEFVRKYKKSPAEVLAIKALDWGAAQSCYKVRYAPPVSRQAKALAKKRIDKLATEEQMLRRVKRQKAIARVKRTAKKLVFWRR